MSRIRVVALLASSVVLLASGAQGASLAAIRERGALHVCAHPDALPFSSQDQTQPGFQLEIAAAIARALGVRLQVDWIVFTRHARRVDCDATMGSIVQGRPEEKGRRRGLLLTKPYTGSGYVLVVPRAASEVRRPEDLKGGRIAVEHSSWPHYLLDTRGIPTASYGSPLEIIEAVAKGEISAGLVSDSYVGWYLKQHPGGSVRVADGFVADPELQWDVVIGLRNADEALLDSVNQAIDRLLAEGTIQGIFAKYGVTYVFPRGR